jgi:tetratricopeptide (TPR) repeat protein
MNDLREPRADVAPAATETLYAVQDVARLTGARVEQLRRWAKSGLLPPRRRDGSSLWYGFPDLIAARTAVDLIDRGVTTRQVREAVEVVRAWRPDLSQPLASLRVYSDHGRLVVRLDDALVEPRSGQAVLALPLGELAEAAQRVGEVVSVEPAARPLDAEGWVARGLDAEVEEDLDEAAACYARALDLEPEHPGALLNLGNVAYQSGQLREACEHYRAATQADPDYAEGWYNLANVLDDLGHLDAAARCYDTALDLAPDFADAHFNLALLWEKSGARERARTHWARFLELVSEGDSADLARSFLAAREDEG